VSATGLLVRLAIRRDRVLVPVWFAVLLLVCYASAASVPGLYPSEVERVKAAEAINASPGIVALYGPILDVHSLGELAMTKMTVLYSVFVAIMLLFVVRRHTRLEEEDGQTELLGGTAITRDTPLTATIVYGFGISVLLGVLAALLNTAGGLPVSGSVAFGASWAGIGLVSTGLTAVACQVSASARTCAAIASSAVGVLFVLRAVGDTSDAGWLSWLTPFGWNTRLRAYGETRWTLLLLYAGTAIVLAGLAMLLDSRRDLGSGLVASRPGPATGSRRLSDVVALALRVHAPMLVGWTVSLAVLGLDFGAISPSFDAFDSAGIEDMLRRIGGEGVLRDTLLGAVISVLAILISCFAVAVVGHGGSDEHDGRTEQVLATATSRARASGRSPRARTPSSSSRGCWRCCATRGYRSR
jgi:ABC-2 type transport system permease protein